jgi:glycosyltransferase involved in cell wall biosynthesis
MRDQCLTAPLRALRFHKIPASLPRLAAFERSYRRCVRSFTVDPAGLLRLGAGRDATPTDPTGQAGVPTIPLRSTDAGADSAAAQHVASVHSDGDPPPKTARVSIGLPVYNGEQFVADAVESVLAQKFDDFELVISDNGSTDGTPAICESYARRDARVTYLAQEANRGASWNFNHVFERTSGELFVWLAHDDVWTPDFLQACVDELDADASAVLAFSGVSNIDERGSLLRTRTFDMRTSSPLVHERLWDVLMVWHDCLPVFGVIRRDALRSTSLIRPYASGDHLLLAELSVLGKFRFTNELLFLSRLHAGQSIQAFNIWVDHYAYSEWFEQSGTRSTSFPQWRLLRDLVTIVRRASVGRVDRVRCYGAVGRWMVRYRSLLLKDLVFAARERRGDPRKRQSPAITSISVATSEDKSGSATDQS